MAIWLLRFLWFWTLLMSTNCGRMYNPYGYFRHQYRDDSGEDYSLPVFLPANRRSYDTSPSKELEVHHARSVATDTQVQKVQKETQRRTDGIISGTKTSPRDGVVFPGPTKETKHQGSFVPVVPSECKTAGFCEALPDKYPKEHITRLLESGDDVRFNVDEVELPDLAQRIGAPEDEEMCGATGKQIMYPSMAQNRDNKWYYIVNTPDKMAQGFRVEICHRHQSPCSSLATFHYGYKAQCIQKYILRLMYAIDENGSMFQDSFRVPSCCTCVVRRLEYRR